MRCSRHHVPLRRALLAVTLACVVGCAPSMALNFGKSVATRLFGGPPLEINGASIRLPCSIEELTLAFGEPSRSRPGENRRYLWDRLGVSCLETNDTKVVVQVSVCFVATGEAYLPFSAYSGVFKFNGDVYGPETTLASLEQRGFDFGIQSMPSAVVGGYKLFLNQETNRSYVPTGRWESLSFMSSTP